MASRDSGPADDQSRYLMDRQTCRGPGCARLPGQGLEGPTCPGQGPATSPTYAVPLVQLRALGHELGHPQGPLSAPLTDTWRPTRQSDLPPACHGVNWAPPHPLQVQPRWAGAGQAQHGPQRLRGALCWWTSRRAHLAEEGGVPLHAVAGVRGLDLRVERADHVVQHLNADVVPPHAGARAPRALVRRLEDLEGPEPGGAGFPRQRSHRLPGGGAPALGTPWSPDRWTSLSVTLSTFIQSLRSPGRFSRLHRTRRALCSSSHT